MTDTDIALTIDASAVPANPAGAGQYIVELVKGVAATPGVHATVLTRTDDAARWRALAPASSVLPVAPRRRPARLAWEQLRLPRLLRRGPVDVYHGPHYTMPERTTVPRVVTVHDMTFFDHPEWHERSKVVVFRRAIAVAVRRADALICVSAATAARLARRFSPRGEVRVIPHGVDFDRFRPADADSDGTDAAVLQALGVRPPYIVFIGTLEPRKDVPSLVRAFDLVAAREPELQLVLAGTPGWGTDAVQEAVATIRHRDRVVITGYVPDAAVPALLRGAAAAAYHSFEEGFGLPALEALACGTPLVTTEGTAMAEAAAGAALLVPPGDSGALAEALAAATAGDGGEARRQRGLDAARGHTWAASVAAHVDLYRTVAAGGRR